MKSSTAQCVCVCVCVVSFSAGSRFPLCSLEECASPYKQGLQSVFMVQVRSILYYVYVRNKVYIVL